MDEAGCSMARVHQSNLILVYIARAVKHGAMNRIYRDRADIGNQRADPSMLGGAEQHESM